MSPHNDAAAPFRWRLRLRALVVALVAATSCTTAVALAATGGTDAKSSGKSAPTLRFGSRGSLVKQLQTRLRVRPASGYYGSKTARKVKFFQADNGLRADGIAGPPTLRALGLVATESSSGGSTQLPAHPQRVAHCE